MASICNPKHSHFQFQFLHLNFGFLRLIIFLSFIHLANTISFDIHSFSNKDILFHGSQAVYKKPMHLWDNATGKLTDFDTQFTFAIKPNANVLSFILFPNDSITQFVSVGFDPLMELVSIRLNSFQKAMEDMKWHCSEKKNFSAVVNYFAKKKTLCVMMVDYVDNSTLTGNSTLCKVVDLREYLPEWVNVGLFAASGRDLAQKYTLHSWQFNSLSLENDETDKNKRNTKWALGLAIGTCAAFASVIIGFILTCLRLPRRPRKRQSTERQNDDVIVDISIDDELERGSGPKRFSYSELEQATNGFDEQGKLGQGGFGGVFSGFLIDLNQIVAVKRFSKGSKQGRKEYKSEVKIISSLRHRNLVQLVGWCHERNELLLVYEYMPNGSLDYHLFLGKSILSWQVRYKIALGLASALLYLHEECEQCVVHRDIKSSNVMLDTNFNAKLGDFGLARLIDHELGPKTTGPAGTMGYIAPEYISTGKASKESDMYSFGIVALEIACGRRAIEPDIEESKIRLVSWVWELYGNENVLDSVDQKLCGDFHVEQMERLLIVGLWCAHPDHNLRPSIRQAVQVLNFEAGIPNIPLKMPVAMYEVPNPSISSSIQPLMTFTSFNVGR